MRISYGKILLSSLLLLLLVSCGEDDPVIPQSDHEEAIGLALFHSDTLRASILRGVPGDTLRVALGEDSEEYDVRFYNDAEAIFEVHDAEKTFSWEIEDASIIEVVQDNGKEGRFEFRFRGLAPGSTNVEFFILHQGHADFRSGKWPVVVQ